MTGSKTSLAVSGVRDLLTHQWRRKSETCLLHVTSSEMLATSVDLRPISRSAFVRVGQNSPAAKADD